jgi:hypothetical protein
MRPHAPSEEEEEEEEEEFAPTQAQLGVVPTVACAAARGTVRGVYDMNARKNQVTRLCMACVRHAGGKTCRVTLLPGVA